MARDACGSITQPPQIHRLALHFSSQRRCRQPLPLEPAQVASGYWSEDAVHRTRFTVGERLLRELQLEASRRVPERGNLLLDEGDPGAGRTLAGPLQHGQTTLVAGLSPACAGGLDHNEPGVWGGHRAGSFWILDKHIRHRKLVSTGRYRGACGNIGCWRAEIAYSSSSHSCGRNGAICCGNCVGSGCSGSTASPSK
jgi:hypothetical protein